MHGANMKTPSHSFEFLNKEPRYSDISTFSALSVCSTFFWFLSLFLSVNHIFGSGYIYGQANL